MEITSSTGGLEVPFTESRAVGRGYIWGRRSRVLSWGVLGLRCLGEVQGRMLGSGCRSRSGAQQESGLE